MLTGLLFVAGLAMLYFGGEGLVRSAGTLGVRFGISPMVAGLTIVAFATSAPELAVAIGAALRDTPGLAVGNVVGSNICNIALILGVTALIKPARIKEQLIRRDVLVMILSTVLVPGFLLDRALSRPEGALLAVSLLAYVTATVWQAKVTPRAAVVPETPDVPFAGTSVHTNSLIAIGSVVMLVYGSDLFVRSATQIAESVGVPPAVVGLSAAAFGTSLPELTASIIAARHGHPEMAAGNLIGSNIFNLLLILGATAVIRPLTLGGISFIDIGVMVGVSFLALGLMLAKPRISRGEGGLLVGIYCVYMAWLFGHGA
jgi:cation:H+ antiporter